MKKFLRASLVVFMMILTLAAMFVFYFSLSAIVCVKSNLENQTKRISDLRAAYSSGQAEKVDEQSFCSFSLSDAIQNDVRFDQVQFLGTHNSYKTEKSYSEKFYSLFSSGLKKGNYSHLNPTEQLNAGIRSFEIDLFYKVENGKTKFYSFHITGLDMSSSAYDFEMFLQEVNMWSNYNQNHLPILISIEAKRAGALSPYKLIDVEQLADFDNVVRKNIDNLYEPQVAVQNFETLLERDEQNPIMLSEVLGKVIFFSNGEDKYYTWKLNNDYSHAIFAHCALFAVNYYCEDNLKLNHTILKTDNFDPADPNCDWLGSPGKTVRLRPRYARN